MLALLYECQDDKLVAYQIEIPDEDDPVCNDMLTGANMMVTLPQLKVIILKSLPLTPRDCLSIGYFGRIKSQNSTQGYPNLLLTQTMVFDLTSCSLSDTGIQSLTAARAWEGNLFNHSNKNTLGIISQSFERKITSMHQTTYF